MNFCFTRVIILYTLVAAYNKILSIKKKKEKQLPLEIVHILGKVKLIDMYTLLYLK